MSFSAVWSYMISHYPVFRRFILLFAIGGFISGLSGCFTRDLEPIAGARVGDTTIGTESENTQDSASGTSTDTQTSDTISKDTDTESETSTIPDTDTETDTDSSTNPGTDLGSDSNSDTADTETDTAEQKKWVGNTTQDGIFPGDYFDLWDQVTPENAGKWGSIEIERDIMIWDELDAIYEEAINNNIKFTAHPLIWDQQQPVWLETLTAEEQAAEVEEWISLFCEHYPEVEMINVVSAPYHQKPFYYEALGGDGVSGVDWVINIYEMARAYCPSADLIVEEYSALIWETHNFGTVVSNLYKEGLIDGIACTGNSLEGISLTDLGINMDVLAAYKLPIYISQFGVANSNDALQLNEMQRLFPALYEHPAVAGITLWGYVKGSTWKADAWLRTEDGTPRPALDWLMAYLEKNQ